MTLSFRLRLTCSRRVIHLCFSALQICADNINLTVNTTVYIDTRKVPRHQQTTCKCTLNPIRSKGVFEFSFIDDDVPTGMVFSVNGTELDQSNIRDIDVSASSTLTLATPVNYTIEKACLYISSGTLFNLIYLE
jgi:hypothetical protein